MTDPLALHRVTAFNMAATSENKIHDDAVASRFGFRGALVPGVAVFGYMAHLPVARWGRAWLERGSAECRFVEPVYHGHDAVAQGRMQEDAVEIELHSDGRLCAHGSAVLPPAAPEALPIEPDFDATPPRERPPADESSLAEGTHLGIVPFVMTAEDTEQWLDDLRETDPIYRRERLAHPAMLLRAANWVLTQNVVLGPWIHVGSRVANFAALPVGAELSAQARVMRNYLLKGHRFVELDIRVLLDGRRLAARIGHTAIYLPRQVAEAALSH